MREEVLISFKTNIFNPHLCLGKWGNPPIGTVAHHCLSYSDSSPIKKIGSFNLYKTRTAITLPRVNITHINTKCQLA